MENIFRDILQKNNKWLILLILGVLLLVIAMPSAQADTRESEQHVLEEEIRLKNILEQMEGVGEAKIMITYRDSKTVEGVVVIADGAGNPSIAKQITDVIQALFDVDSHRIKVIKGNQRN